MQLCIYAYMYVPFVVVDISRMQVSMLYFFSYICPGNVFDVGNIYLCFRFVRWIDEWMDEMEWIECNVMNVWIQYTLLYVFACSIIWAGCRTHLIVGPCVLYFPKCQLVMYIYIFMEAVLWLYVWEHLEQIREGWWCLGVCAKCVIVCSARLRWRREK